MADNSVKIRIDGDTSGFEKALSKIEQGAKTTVKNVIKGTATLGTAFGAATVAGLNFAGELEQNIGGSEAVFEKFASEIQGSAETAFKNMGLSTSEYLATANKMGALFKGSGFELSEAADMTTKAMQRASDVASIMGIDVSAAMESIAGAAKGNFTMMDNLGVAMNDTTLNAYALEIGLGKTTQQMTNQEKVALAMEMFLDRTAYAAGNYAKENDTLSGSLTTAKAALENFMAGTGNVDEVIESVTHAGEIIIENLGELVPKLTEGAGKLIEELMGTLLELIADNAPQMIEAAVNILEAFIFGIGANSDKIAVAAVSIIRTLANAIVLLIPEIVSAASQLMAAFAQEISNAFPLLTPFANIIKLLADNMQLLITAVIMYVAVSKGMAIVQSVTTWWKTAQIACIKYTAALNMQKQGVTGSVTANAALETGLSVLQVVSGLVTGKLQLETAATWALKAAKDALKGVAGLLIGTLVSLAAQHLATANATAVDTQAALSYKSAVDEVRESLSQTIQTTEDSIASETAKAQTAQVLKDELFSLEEQINSGKLSEEEATVAKENFKAVSNQLIDILPKLAQYIGSETDEYSLQKKAIEDLTDSYIKYANAKAFASAYEERMTETAKGIAKLDDSFVLKNRSNQKITIAIKKARNGNYLRVKNLNDVVVEDYEDYDEFKEMTVGEAMEIPEFREVAEAALGSQALRIYEEKERLEQNLSNDAISMQRFVNEMSDFTEEQLKDFEGTTETTGKAVAQTAKETAGNYTDTVKAVVKEQNKTVEQMLDDEVRALERNKRAGLISEQEYYTRLAGIRDKYFKAGTEDWQSYTKKIEDFYDNALVSAKKKVEEIAEDMQEKVDSLSDKFKDDTNKTYAKITLDADGKVETWYTLADMNTQNKQLDEYLGKLKQLKEVRGNIPEQALAELQKMDTEEALRFLDVMLKASDKEWQDWTSGIEENAKKSQRLSEELYLDEIKENQALIQRIKDEWEGVPDDFFDIGGVCGKKYGEGFKEKIMEIMNDIKGTFSAVFSGVAENVSLAANGYGVAAQTSNYTDNRTTNIYAPSSSPRAIIEAQNQAAVYQQHTSKFGG